MEKEQDEEKVDMVLLSRGKLRVTLEIICDKGLSLMCHRKLSVR